MTSVLALLVVLALFVLLAYAGQRDGVFEATYSLVQNFLGFLFALTFCEPLAGVLAVVISDEYPAYEYFVAISFAAILGGVFVGMRYFFVKFTFADTHCVDIIDRIGGGAIGATNAVVLTGTLLVLWSLLPFVKYVPANYGDAAVSVRSVDTGLAMLHVYDWMEQKMPDGREFLMEPEPLAVDLNENGRWDPGDEVDDINGNGVWDRGWAWRYRHHASITPQDLREIPGVEVE